VTCIFGGCVVGPQGQPGLAVPEPSGGHLGAKLPKLPKLLHCGVPRRPRRRGSVAAAALVALLGTTLVSPPAHAGLCLALLGCTPPPPPPPPSPVPYTLLGPVRAGVAAGDYLLSATVASTSGTIQVEVAQQEGGAGAPERNADGHAGLTSQVIHADVRVTGPGDTFSILASGTGQASGLSFTPAHWSYLVRGQRITSPANPDVAWHGVNSNQGMVADDYAALHQNTAATFVRVPVEEYEWLPFFTTNYVPGYRAQIIAQVNAITAQGLVAMIDLHDAGHDQPGYAPQSGTNNDQLLADQHSLSFWDDAASLWANNPSVVFETFNEPKVNEGNTYPPDGLTADQLWRDGGRIQDMAYTTDVWTAPGEQQLVNRIRADGANNLIMIQGMSWGGDLRMIENNPIDGTNLVYSFHAYTDSSARESTTSYPAHLDSDIDPVWEPQGGYAYALFCSEFGTSQQDLPLFPMGSRFLSSTINWISGRDLGWSAWGWYPYNDNYELLIPNGRYEPMTLDSKGQTVVGNM
jgi:hypothetical protein